ncbi:recombinase family protein [Kitasatospora sp. NPDC101235]|uniref:recombinase family protein n=1 Tax=Kitasatospora sp. NPDC101235 TaxID=3364101 RepID=UPI003827A909
MGIMTVSAPVRAVVGSRVSDTHGDEGKVSHLVQAESATRHAVSKEWEIVGSFEDLDVSAQITPWKRPDLGPWLTERQGEWDAMVWAKVDRAFRSAKDCADMAHWAEENHKVLVFTDDGITLDYREGRESSFGNELAKTFLMLASIFAEMELKRIKARVTAAHKHLRKTDRWAGGQPPYGYRIVDRPGGGRTLEPDPVTSEAVRYMGKLLLEGQSQWMIATALEAAGFDTPATHAYKNQGDTYTSKRKTPPSNHWNPTSVGKILRSPATMGLKLTGRSVKARKIARDAKGLPIRMAKPLFMDEEWAAIQAAMDERSVTKERSNGASPWLGVPHCDRCGDRFYRQVNLAKNGKIYEYYRCAKTAGKPACKGQSVKGERVTAAINALVERLASLPMTVRRFIPGEDHTEQLNHVTQAMRDLREEKRRNLFDYPGGDDEYSEALELLVDERRRLAALPQRPSTWVDVETGETLADAWFQANQEHRRQLLLGLKARLYMTPATEGWYLPAELQERERQLKCVDGSA